MVEMSFTHVLPPNADTQREEYYTKGYRFGADALSRYGAETCNKLRKTWSKPTSYEQGAMDAFDKKPNKYGKDI